MPSPLAPSLIIWETASLNKGAKKLKNPLLYKKNSIIFATQKKPIKLYCKATQAAMSEKIVRGVAQLASVLAWGASGRKFESSHPDGFKKGVSVFETPFFILKQHRVG